MLKLEVVAPRQQKDQLLKLLQQFGAFEICELKKDAAFNSAALLGQELSSAKDLIKKAIDVIDGMYPDTGSLKQSLNGPTVLTTKEFYKAQNALETAVDAAGDVLRKVEYYKSIVTKIESVKDLMQKARPYEGFGYPIPVKDSAHASFFVGSIPGAMTAERILELINARLGPAIPVAAYVISSDKRETRAAFSFLKKDKGKVTEAVLAAGFMAAPFECEGPPKRFIYGLRGELKDLMEIKYEYDTGMRVFISTRHLLRRVYDYILAQEALAAAADNLVDTRRCVYMKGFLPASLKSELEGRIGTKGVSLIFSTPGPDDDVPVLLKNNRFAGAVEGVVSSYSLPGKGDIDPSPQVSVFYYLLFGLMLADAAYGLIITIGCAVLLWRFKNMKASLKKAVRMFLYCGISTTVWGFVFGSFFGDAVLALSSAFFGKEIALGPIWFEPIDDPMKMLLFALGVGLVHIIFALCLKVYVSLKNRDALAAVGDGFSWIGLIISLVILLMTSSIFESIAGMRLALSSPVLYAVIALAVICALAIVLLGGRESKNPVKRLLKGLYALYGISGYLSDLLSYSRLLALGLATGVIATVVNQMATMLGGSVIGIIVFVLIFVLGHAINFGINILGAYVHTNRLEYIEFFGKFYEGGGKAFEPLDYNTKYYQVKEEKENG